MAEDLDPTLLRVFAQAESAPAAEPFVSQVAAHVHSAHGVHLAGATIYSMIGTVLGTVAGGMLLPLRMRQTRLMTLGAAAATIVAAFL